jgi:thiol-disulfide isomerase/thioredoxin
MFDVRRAPLRRLVLALTVVVIGNGGIVAPPVARAQAPAAEPARSLADVQRELEAASQAMSDAVPSLDALYDPAKRPAVADKALPAMRRMARALEEFARAEPRAADQVGRSLFELRGWMAVLGDPGSDDEIRRLTLSKNDDEATAARAWSVVVRWAKGSREPPAQEKLVAELAGLARARPEHPTIAQAGAIMAETAATAALSEMAERVVAQDLKGPVAKEVAQVLAARRKLRSLVGKPLVVEGRTADGGRFSTAAWKGKVVLVTFWATWSGPARTDMPEVRKLYADHHAAGLEVLGVSSDRDVEDLKGYLAENKDMPWPQLFEPGKPGSHPLVGEYGIDAIPTMFLIDRKGVVRSVNARDAVQGDGPEAAGGEGVKVARRVAVVRPLCRPSAGSCRSRPTSFPTAASPHPSARPEHRFRGIAPVPRLRVRPARHGREPLRRVRARGRRCGDERERRAVGAPRPRRASVAYARTASGCSGTARSCGTSRVARRTRATPGVPPWTGLLVAVAFLAVFGAFVAAKGWRRRRRPEPAVFVHPAAAAVARMTCTSRGRPARTLPPVLPLALLGWRSTWPGCSGTVFRTRGSPGTGRNGGRAGVVRVGTARPALPPAVVFAAVLYLVAPKLDADRASPDPGRGSGWSPAPPAAGAVVSPLCGSARGSAARRDGGYAHPHRVASWRLWLVGSSCTSGSCRGARGWSGFSDAVR